MHTGALRVTVTVVGGVVLMVMVADLAVVPAATPKVMVPVDPPAGSPVMRVASLVDADHAHPAVFKVRTPLPPPEPNVKLVGETESAEQLTAAWLTVNVATTAPPLVMFNAPMRNPPSFASTL